MSSRVSDLLPRMRECVLASLALHAVTMLRTFMPLHAMVRTASLVSLYLYVPLC